MPQLLEMLAEMKSEDIRASSLRKDELVDWVAEQAAAKTWAPAGLSWAVRQNVAGDEDDAASGEPDGEEPDGAGADGETDEGSGAFVVTAAGEAALDPAAA